jgi:hypothetical protein
MAIHIIELINPCDRPNCGDFPFLEFVSFPGTAAHLQNMSVSWRILNTDSVPTNTEVHYSLNSSSLDNRVNSATSNGIYSAGDNLFSIIPFQGKHGVLLIQARAIIDGVMYLSDIESIVIDISSASCFPEWIVDPDTPGNLRTDVYMEFGTWYVPDHIQIIGNYDTDTCSGNVLYDTGCASTLDRNSRYPGAYPPTLWNSGLQLYPHDEALYLNSRDKLPDVADFQLGGIWHDCFQIHESDLPIGVRTVPNCFNSSGTAYAFYVLGPDFSIDRFGSTKTDDLDCQDVRTLKATIHYQTYTIRDDIIVFSSSLGDPCNEPIDPDKVLWRSGCVGTARGEGPGLSGGEFGSTGKYDTFKYSEIDTPFTISVLPNCGGTSGTAWCAKVYYEDGSLAWDNCGTDTPVCSDSDTEAPTPDPATFAIAPGADSDTAISMTATTGTDATGPVEYYFAETSGSPGGNDSGWQTSPSYTDSGLTASTQYTYTVQMRDSVTPPNVGTSSSSVNATTNDPPTFTLKDTIDDGGSALNVWGDGTHIYLANADSLRAYTFNGTIFINVGIKIDGGNLKVGVWGDGTYIYLANKGDGLRAYTFNGTTFTLKDTIDDGGSAVGIWGDGTYIYLANDTDGLRAYTFNGTTFTNVGHIDDGGFAFGVWTDGTYIYLANDTDGLRAYTFNGTTFTNVGHINDGGNSRNVWSDGTYIYLTSSNSGLRAYTFV